MQVSSYSTKQFVNKKQTREMETSITSSELQRERVECWLCFCSRYKQWHVHYKQSAQEEESTWAFSDQITISHIYISSFFFLLLLLLHFYTQRSSFLRTIHVRTYTPAVLRLIIVSSSFPSMVTFSSTFTSVNQEYICIIFHIIPPYACI